MTVFSLSKSNLMRGVAITTLSVFVLSLATPVVVWADEPPVSNHNDTVTAAETQAALLDTPGILGSSDQVVTKSDADSAIVATTADTSVDVPKDPEQGVTFGATDGPKLEVALPSADQASNAKQVAPGVVAYDSGNGSANAVQANEDGSVRMLTIIDNPSAPTEYDYKVTVPEGGSIQLTEDGGAIVVDGNGEPFTAVGAPWAKDANSTPVQTYFTTDGQTLTQHVEHNVPGVVYPVTADPVWLAIAAGMIGGAAIACASNVLQSLGTDGVRWAIQRGDWYWNKKLDDALWNCATGAAFGWTLKFAPSSIKNWARNQIKNTAKSILKWRV